MKKKKILLIRLFAIMFALLIAITAVPSIPLKADDDVKPTDVKITVAKKTVTAGKKFKLYAKLSPTNADDDDIRWSIVKGKGVVRFDDDDRDDDDVELKAIKAGTAKVKCQIKGTNKKAYVTIKVKTAKAKQTIKIVGKKNRTVEVGDDFELKVKKGSGVKNKHLKWTIKNTKIVRFDDDKYGNEAEFEAIRVGKTTIICKNTKTKKTVKYVINVINDYDDDDD